MKLVLFYLLILASYVVAENTSYMTATSILSVDNDTMLIELKLDVINNSSQPMKLMSCAYVGQINEIEPFVLSGETNRFYASSYVNCNGKCYYQWGESAINNTIEIIWYFNRKFHIEYYGITWSPLFRSDVRIVESAWAQYILRDKI